MSAEVMSESPFIESVYIIDPPGPLIVTSIIL